MDEAFDTRELAAALDDDAGAELTITDLPNDVLVSIFIAAWDSRWARHTIPCVCTERAELYRSQDASPLHEKLEVDFRKELERALRERLAFRGLGLRRPVVHASRVISWAERRAGWVRELHLAGNYSGALKDLSPEDLGRLVAVVGPSSTALRIGPDPNQWESTFFELCQKPSWKSLRASVFPARRLRSFVVRSADASESDVEPLGQLAGSLEELALSTLHSGDDGSHKQESGLPRFPESFRALTELRHLELVGHARIKAISAKISSLKELQVLDLACCRLSSLPKELGELSGLTDLKLAGNMHLGNAPQDEAFPAELGRMKSLRLLALAFCGLRAVPAFVGGLQSLERLGLSSELQVDTATFDVPIEGCPRLRRAKLYKSEPWTPESLAHLEAFKAKLLAKNPKAVVIC